VYQYDAHRIPWRIGIDYCWNGGADAKTYLGKTSGFFQSQTAAGIAKLPDILNLDGSAGPSPAPNSSSIIGTAAVGAMSDAAYKTFLDDAYQSIFDQTTRGTMAPVDTAGKTPYSYYNATVGLLTLLTMTGNFKH
jgi:endoglucanase